MAAVCLAALVAGVVRGRAEATDPYRVTVVQTTSSLSQAMATGPSLEFGSARATAGPVVHVDGKVGYQRVRGFGAAMTDTSAWLIERHLSPASRARLMSELFGASGLGLDFVKVPMGASDFTHNGRPYSYDDLPAGRRDPTLSRFSTAHDRAYILPALRQARALAPGIEFMGTPWSPPGWMKANDSLANVADRGRVLAADEPALARYFVKFVQAYARAGIPIGALSVANEPSVPTMYPGSAITGPAEVSFIAHDLDPALAAARLHPRVYGGELGWGQTTTYQRATLRAPGSRALAGLGWHCYFGSPTVMTAFHRTAPRLDQIVDECSPGLSSTPTAEVVIASLRNWASTVAMWNLALDPTGGPAQLPNHGCKGCRGLVTIDPATGGVRLGLDYDQLGQASAFIRPGARRIASSTFVTYSYPKRGADVASPGLDDVAVRNPDGSLVLLAYDTASHPVSFSVAWKGRAFRYTLPAGATATFTWNRPS